MSLKKKWKVIILSVISFLLSLQLGFTTFIDSEFLSHLLKRHTSTPDNYVGYIFAFDSLLGLLIMLFFPKILRKSGARLVLLASSILLPIALFCMYLEPHVAIAIMLGLIITISSTLIFAVSDILLSSYVDDNHTGIARGLYFALMSLGFMISPAISGYVVSTHGLKFAYLLGASCVILLPLISYFPFRKFTDDSYEDVPFLPNKELRKKASDLMPVFWSHFSLQAFYAIMTIYAPLYFIEKIGLGRDEFGYILTIALSTFVILPTFLGYIADKILGEKEMITLGIVLMGLSLISIPILSRHPQSLFVWGIVLFVSRVGATLTESMTDVFFFKKIEHAHPALIAFYRRARPLALFIIPGICAALLSIRLFDISELFILAGILIISCTYFSSKLVDTK